MRCEPCEIFCEVNDYKTETQLCHSMSLPQFWRTLYKGSIRVMHVYVLNCQVNLCWICSPVYGKDTEKEYDPYTSEHHLQ